MQKVIFLVDMNAFFISCEALRNQNLQNRPSAVAGNPKKRTGIILTANYEARKYGVKTAMTINQALKLCPHLILVSPDHHFYRKKSQEVIDLLYNYTPKLQKSSIDEAWLDMTGTQCLFGPPIKVAKKIMEDIKSNLGLWCSIGISENKFLAKMASEIKKPMGITELWQKDIQSKMWPLPINAMYGIGEKTANKLQNLGITTIGQLATMDQMALYHRFGKYGLEIHQHANGIDFSPIEQNSLEDIKSISRSITLPMDITDIEKLKYVLMELSEEIGRTARKYNKKGSTVHVVIKFSDFTTINRQTTLPLTYYTKDIFEATCRLLEKNLPLPKSVRLIGISLKSFQNTQSFEQVSFFSMTKEKDHKHKKIDKVMDEIRNKYGSEKIARASLIKNNKKNHFS